MICSVVNRFFMSSPFPSREENPPSNRLRASSQGGTVSCCWFHRRQVSTIQLRSQRSRRLSLWEGCAYGDRFGWRIQLVDARTMFAMAFGQDPPVEIRDFTFRKRSLKRFAVGVGRKFANEFAFREKLFRNGREITNQNRGPASNHRAFVPLPGADGKYSAH